MTMISTFGNWLITWFNLSRLAESNSRLASISAGQYLKFCYDIPSFAMLSTLNNPQDLDLEYMEANFPVKWKYTVWRDKCVSAPISWNRSHCSKNSDGTAVTLVQQRDHS